MKLHPITAKLNIYLDFNEFKPVDSIIRQELEKRVAELVATMPDTQKPYVRAHANRILGLSEEPKKYNGLFCDECKTWCTEVCCPSAKKETKQAPTQESGEKFWCEHYRINAHNWYEREASVGSGVFNVVVHNQDAMCAVCGTPRPSKLSMRKLEPLVTSIYRNYPSDSWQGQIQKTNDKLNEVIEFLKDRKME